MIDNGCEKRYDQTIVQWLRDESRNLHLMTSATVISAAGVVYGIAPKATLPFLMDLRVENVDLIHFFRAVMMLYLTMAGLWIVGVVLPSFWHTATVSNIFLMGGLASGRLLSIFLDGVPSGLFLFGLFCEVILMVWGTKNLTAV